MKHKQEHITYPNLPLAIYRELAAHLRQIQGVSTQLIPQKSQQFDYAQSQIDHLEMSYSVELSSQEKQRLEECHQFIGCTKLKIKPLVELYVIAAR